MQVIYSFITLYYHSAHDSIKNRVGIQKNLSCHNELLELLNNFETKTVYPVLWHFLFWTVDCLDSLIYVVKCDLSNFFAAFHMLNNTRDFLLLLYFNLKTYTSTHNTLFDELIGLQQLIKHTFQLGMLERNQRICKD